MKKKKHNSIKLSLRPDVVLELLSRNGDHRARVKAGCGRSAVEIKAGKRKAKIYELDRIDGDTASKPK